MKLMQIQAHCRDCFSCDVFNTETNKTEYTHDGYVPKFIFNGGDDLSLTIDMDTGIISNWDKVKAGYEAEIENSTYYEG